MMEEKTNDGKELSGEKERVGFYEKDPSRERGLMIME
jgi:hypothetical protein